MFKCRVCGKEQSVLNVSGSYAKSRCCSAGCYRWLFVRARSKAVKEEMIANEAKAERMALKLNVK